MRRMKGQTDQRTLSERTRRQSAGGTKGLWRRLKSSLWHFLHDSAFLGNDLHILSFQDIGPQILPFLDVAEISRRADEIRTNTPGLRILTIRASAIARFQSRPMPQEAVRLLTKGSCWPVVRFFEVPSTHRHGDAPGREASQILLAAKRQTGIAEFDLFADDCSCGDYSIYGIDAHGCAYHGFGLTF